MKISRQVKLNILRGKRPIENKIKPTNASTLDLSLEASESSEPVKPPSKGRIEWFSDPFLLAKRVRNLTNQGNLDQVFELMARHTGVRRMLFILEYRPQMQKYTELS